MAILEEIARPTITIPLGISIIYVLYLLLIKAPKVPANLPWAGGKSGPFAKFRASVRGSTDQVHVFEEGYNKWSKKNQYWVTPNLVGGPMVVMGQKDVKWLLSQPASVLDHEGPQMDLLSSQHTMNTKVLGNQDHVLAIRRDLTRQVGQLTGPITDEVACALEDLWGTDTENWKEVSTYTSIMQIVTRAANRLIVGLPVCQDPDYISRAYYFAQTMAAAGLLLRGVPKWMKHFIAPFVVLPNKWCAWQYERTVAPTIRKRLDEWEAQRRNPSKDYEEPNDMLQWIINVAAAKKVVDPKDLQEYRIAVRLAMVNFAAIHTSTFSGVNLMLDLLSSPPSKHYWETLRKECQDVLVSSGGKWTKEGLDRMYGIDSAIRESLRVNSLQVCALRREVVAPGGVTLPDGSHAPQGTNLGIGSHGINKDDRVHDDPSVFDPLRFSRTREALVKEQQAQIAQNGEKIDTEEVLKHKHMAAVAVGDSHLAFSHGNHACPGRFFAVNELKIVFAHILLNYEVEPLPRRPTGTWFLDFSAPPMMTNIRIRRRKDSVTFKT